MSGGHWLLDDPLASTRYARENYRLRKLRTEDKLLAAARAGLLRPQVNIELVARTLATLARGND